MLPKQANCCSDRNYSLYVTCKGTDSWNIYKMARMHVRSPGFPRVLSRSNTPWFYEPAILLFWAFSYDCAAIDLHRNECHMKRFDIHDTSIFTNKWIYNFPYAFKVPEHECCVRFSRQLHVYSSALFLLPRKKLPQQDLHQPCIWFKGEVIVLPMYALYMNIGISISSMMRK